LLATRSKAALSKRVGYNLEEERVGYNLEEARVGYNLEEERVTYVPLIPPRPNFTRPFPLDFTTISPTLDYTQLSLL
jgi:hypothetical protein